MTLMLCYCCCGKPPHLPAFSSVTGGKFIINYAIFILLATDLPPAHSFLLPSSLPPSFISSSSHRLSAGLHFCAIFIEKCRRHKGKFLCPRGTCLLLKIHRNECLAPYLQRLPIFTYGSFSLIGMKMLNFHLPFIKLVCFLPQN